MRELTKYIGLNEMVFFAYGFAIAVQIWEERWISLAIWCLLFTAYIYYDKKLTERTQ